MKRFLMLAATVAAVAFGASQMAVAHDGHGSGSRGHYQSSHRNYQGQNYSRNHNYGHNHYNHGHNHGHNHGTWQNGYRNNWSGYSTYRNPGYGQGTQFYFSQPGFSIGIGSGAGDTATDGNGFLL